MDRANLQHAVVFGLGWGDEGKGKIVDMLCPGFDAVVRFNGGANAGHTVWVSGEKFALHLLPTGALHPHAIAVIGPGVVIDPTRLLAEIDGLTARGIELGTRLKISDRAHLVLGYHKIEDRLSERSAGDDGKIGTTAQGIGPCYADKMRRTTAVRVTDLFNEPDLDERLRKVVESRKAMLRAVHGDDGGLDPLSVLAEVQNARQRLRPFVCDTTDFLHDLAHSKRAILFEGANGLLLDIDHGTYPFVTSSSTGPHGIGSGAGVPLSSVRFVIGVVKAYATRVGSGPFVSELRNELGDRIRKQGNEFGTTTGRPRRCGWFDAVLCRYSARITSATDVALMHLDTLSGFDRVGVCVAYRCDGEMLSQPPADARRLERAEPVLEYMPGWSGSLRNARRLEDLPVEARRYVERVEQLVGASVSIIGVGPDRAETIVRGEMIHLLRA